MRSPLEPFMENDKTPKKILVIRNDAIGDLTLTIPMLNTLKRTWPSCEIYVLVQPYTKDVLAGHPAVNGVIVDKKKIGKVKGLSGFLKYVRFIKALQFDAVIHAVLNPYEACLCAAAGIPIRIGDGKKLVESLFLTRKVNLNFSDFMTHETVFLKQLLKGFRMPMQDSSDMDVYVSQAAMARSEEILNGAGWTGESLIGIHPATGGGNRAWTAQGYAELITMIETQTTYRCVLTGFGPKELSTIETILSETKGHPLVLYNQTSLEELKAVISRMAVIIGTDTGPTHLAAALKVPVVCVTPTKFVKALRWGPWGTPHKIVSEAHLCPLACYPFTCTAQNCVEGITPKRVFESMMQLLSEKVIDNRASVRLNWFKTSMTVMIVIQSQKDKERVLAIQKEAIAQGLHLIIAPTLQNPFEWASFLAKNDVTLLYLTQGKWKWIWYILTRLAALNMYAPPRIAILKGDVMPSHFMNHSIGEFES